MRNRLICGMLAFVLLICLIPAAAIPASAASELESSEKVIRFIKEVEGFNAAAYWDVNRWSIGYGTAGYRGQRITMEAADEALRNHLETIDEKLNDFADTYDLDFTQSQHDALASFSFNCGTGWMKSDGRFRDAVIDEETGDEFLFAICLWANLDSYPEPSLLERRLCEANMFLNGKYSPEMPSQYTYVIFDPNGGTAGNDGEDKMQGYRLDGSSPILVEDPEKDDLDFLGWFTERVGGTQVRELTAATAKKTLYAHYEGDTSEEELYKTVIANGTVFCDTYVNIRKGAGTGYGLSGKAMNGTKLEIFEIKTVGGTDWGRTRSGWISLDYVEMEDREDDEDEEEEEKVESPSAKPIDSGRVISSTNLNVRSGPGTDNTRVNFLSPGTKVSVYEVRTVRGTLWGRIGNRSWVCLDYVLLDSDSETEDTDEEKDGLYEGYVSSVTNLNVRTGPGTNYTRVKSLSPGTKVTVFEEKLVNGISWGRIQSGNWVCLSYISEDSDDDDFDEDDSEDTLEGWVISQTVLNVRAGAGTGYRLVTQLRPGTWVTILETKKSGGTTWGRTARGWLSMDYIQLDD